jgi:hypothetical protein
MHLEWKRRDEMTSIFFRRVRYGLEVTLRVTGPEWQWILLNRLENRQMARQTLGPGRYLYWSLKQILANTRDLRFEQSQNRTDFIRELEESVDRLRQELKSEN